MKILICFLFALCAVCLAGPTKRFAEGSIGLSNVLSAVGGNLGCVVTGDKLYVNGLFEKDLDGSEKEEFEQYQQKLTDFKKQIREAIAQRRQELVASRKNKMNNMFNIDDSSSDEANANAANAVASASVGNTSALPNPPEKPSFCSANATTQYIFDGCKVQNGKVYVGNTLARSLTPEEQEQLTKFDKQMTEYQKQLSSSLQKQVQELFGDQLASLFGVSSGNRAKPTPAPEDEATTTAAPLAAPDAPNFCTIIY